MIQIDSLSKSYGNVTVFENFSYTFAQTGFYLLFGESGSGKTSLLNLLAGLSSIDSGTITIDGSAYSDIVPPNKQVEYMTQDSCFINFLTMEENLTLSGTAEEIHRFSEMFGLSDRLSVFPLKLSGGEKQRFALIRALLNGRKVLLLDEPTASLDEENARRVFSQLALMKDQVLIICASHDPIAKEYAGHHVEISKATSRAPGEANTKTAESTKTHESVVIHHSSVKPYLKKWFHSEYRNRKTDFLFCIFMTAALIICCMVTPSAVKIDATQKYAYRINSCHLTVNSDVSFETIKESGSVISDIMLSYQENIPLEDMQSHPSDAGVIQSLPSYEVFAGTLPFRSDLFRLADKLRYGHYYTDTNQIILSKEMADSVMPDRPDALIGKKITKSFYGTETVELEIVGIFDTLTDFDRAYLNALGCQYRIGNAYHPDDYTRLYFVNNQFTEQYLQNTEFQLNGNRNYYLLFNSYDDVKAYCQQTQQLWSSSGGRLSFDFVDPPLQRIMTVFYFILLPLCILIAFFTIVFYCNIICVETNYQSSFLSVFEYQGYSIRRVLKEYRRMHFCHFCILATVSSAVAFFSVFLLNALNRMFVFVPFYLFTPHVPFIALFLALLLVSSYLILYVSMRRIRYRSWYEIITENRDLL